jgi:hypothetical protein
MELEYITRGEFGQTMDAFREQIKDGFSETHRLQRETNGRLLKAESAVAVLEHDRHARQNVWIAILSAALTIVAMVAAALILKRYGL